MKLSRVLPALCALLISAICYAAASQGLKWNAVTTDSDGAALDPGVKIVYAVISQDTGKQVYSTFDLGALGSKLPADGCYYLKAAFYASATNSIIPNSDSIPTSAACTKATPPPPVQKRAATPTGFGVQ